MSEDLGRLWRDEAEAPHPGRVRDETARLDAARRRLRLWVAAAQTAGLAAAVWVDASGFTPIPWLLSALCLAALLRTAFVWRRDAESATRLAGSTPAGATAAALGSARRNLAVARWMTAFPPAVGLGVGLGWLVDGRPTVRIPTDPVSIATVAVTVAFVVAVWLVGRREAATARSDLAELEARLRELEDGV